MTSWAKNSHVEAEIGASNFANMHALYGNGGYPFIQRTPAGRPRLPAAAAHVER